MTTISIKTMSGDTDTFTFTQEECKQLTIRDLKIRIRKSSAFDNPSIAKQQLVKMFEETFVKYMNSQTLATAFQGLANIELELLITSDELPDFGMSDTSYIIHLCKNNNIETLKEYLSQ